MVHALQHELNLQRQYLKNNEIETIYFGGGTPSLLKQKELEQILEKIFSYNRISSNVEITLEVNPDDLNYDKLKNLRKLGINRLSIGVQSFSDEVLKFLNRIHSGKEAYYTVLNAQKAGFDNISVDLIYGIEKSGHSGWQNDLKIVGELLPEHISAYCLTIESQTAFGTWMKKGKLKPVDEDYAAQQFEYLIKFLSIKGYDQYEISNFCQPEKYSIHNTNYWKQENYLGIGPGAHSYNGQSRQFNISHNIKYIQSIESGNVPYEQDILSNHDKINEYVMTSLRTRWGCNLSKIYKDYKIDLYEINKDYINDLITQEYINFINNILYLTTKGKLIADKIASDLFLTSS